MITLARILAAAFGLRLAAAAFAETRFTSFTFENDFFAGYDRHYTNGVQAAFLADLQGAPGWVRSLTADPQAVIAIGQRIYTHEYRREDPAPTTRTPEDLHDVRMRTPRATSTFDGDLRISARIGARQTQNGFHHLTQGDTAQGWDTQVRTRATLMAGYERAWPAVLQGNFAKRQFDLSLRTGATVGTPLTYADVGAVLRYGSHLPSDLPVIHISLGPPRTVSPARRNSLVRLGVRARPQAVAYNSSSGTDLRVDRAFHARNSQRRAGGRGVAWLSRASASRWCSAPRSSRNRREDPTASANSRFRSRSEDRLKNHTDLPYATGPVSRRTSQTSRLEAEQLRRRRAGAAPCPIKLVRSSAAIAARE